MGRNGRSKRGRKRNESKKGERTEKEGRRGHSVEVFGYATDPSHQEFMLCCFQMTSFY